MEIQMIYASYSNLPKKQAESPCALAMGMNAASFHSYTIPSPA